jgi:hypothetical protein
LSRTGEPVFIRQPLQPGGLGETTHDQLVVMVFAGQNLQSGQFISQLFRLMDQDREMLRADPQRFVLEAHGNQGSFSGGTFTVKAFLSHWFLPP